MSYIFAKLIDNEDTFDFIEIMGGFDCKCSLMTKVEMMGRNLFFGDYIVIRLDDEEEVEIDSVIIVDEEGIDARTAIIFGYAVNDLFEALHIPNLYVKQVEVDKSMSGEAAAEYLRQWMKEQGYKK